MKFPFKFKVFVDFPVVILYCEYIYEQIFMKEPWTNVMHKYSNYICKFSSFRLLYIILTTSNLAILIKCWLFYIKYILRMIFGLWFLVETILVLFEVPHFNKFIMCSFRTLIVFIIINYSCLNLDILLLFKICFYRKWLISYHSWAESYPSM